MSHTFPACQLQPQYVRGTIEFEYRIESTNEYESTKDNFEAAIKLLRRGLGRAEVTIK